MLMIEFWENNKKTAECPASEVFDQELDAQRSFWRIQDLLDRSIKLREEEGRNEKANTCR